MGYYPISFEPTEPAVDRPHTHRRRAFCTPEKAYRGLRMANPGHRFYSANLAQWVSRDAIGERGGHNLYGFVRNNTQRYVDTDGRGIYDLIKALKDILSAKQDYDEAKKRESCRKEKKPQLKNLDAPECTEEKPEESSWDAMVDTLLSVFGLVKAIAKTGAEGGGLGLLHPSPISEAGDMLGIPSVPGEIGELVDPRSDSAVERGLKNLDQGQETCR